MSHTGKQAGDDFTVRRQAHPRAARAKGLGHRRDHADIAVAVDKFVIHRRRAALVPADFSERITGVDCFDDLSLRY